MPRPNQEPYDPLIVLRVLTGWSQRRLAEVTGLDPADISNYELGKTIVPPEVLQRLVAAMGYPSFAIDRAASFARMMRQARATFRPGNPVDVQQLSIEALAAELAFAYGDFLRTSLQRFCAGADVLDARRRASALWARLRPRAPEVRTALISAGEEFRSWALCELICDESEKAAADCAADALELATLALQIAESTVGESPSPSCLQGYAWAFLGNARRVGSDLDGADAAFARSAELWQAGAASGFAPLDGSRLLDLEASLRCDQRRFSEALGLLDAALAESRSGHATARLQVKKAKTLEALGDCPAAIVVLRQAAPLIDSEGEPRLLFVLEFNLASALCLVGRALEAEAMLPSLRARAEKAAFRLDLVRVLWLEARVAAGLRRPERAIAAFKQAREKFLAEHILYDAALVTVELAEVYAAEGRTAEAKALARQSATTFEAQGVPLEAQRALKLFAEAAEQQRLTPEQARRVVAYLYRARHDPQLPFEAAA
jgi:transcriptional regulator with XRE-family HTH domain